MTDSRAQDKFVIRLPDGLRPEIATVAYRNQRSMNGEIIHRLERSLALELVLDWAELHQEELLRDWDLCQQHQQPAEIAPLE